MRQLTFLYILLVISTFTSCYNKDNERVIKFIFVNGIGISYDSLKKPQLEIQKYLEYSQNEKIRIAVGSRYNAYSKSHTLKFAPPFSLDNFYEANRSDSLDIIVNSTLLGKLYDTLYSNSDTEGRHYNFFIYETSSGIKKIILFYKGSLPKELDSLDSFVNKVFASRELTVIDRFAIDNSVVELQNKLFDRFPPPPPPTHVDSKIITGQ